MKLLKLFRSPKMENESVAVEIKDASFTWGEKEGKKEVRSVARFCTFVTRFYANATRSACKIC